VPVLGYQTPLLHNSQYTAELKYDDNPDFNQEIDNNYKPIVIFDATFQPNKVLFEMEPETYRLALQDFRQQQMEDLKETICNYFPTPIAYNFYRLEYGYENELQRLYFLRDLWESLIRLLYAIFVGEFCFSRIVIQETNIKLSEILTEKLANKLMIIERFIQIASSKGHNFFCLDLISLEVIQKMRELNQARNEFSHSAVKSEEQARQIFSQYYDEVIFILQEIRGLQNIRLMRYYDQANSVLEPRFEFFVGHSMNRTIKSIKVSLDQLHEWAPYLHRQNILVMNKAKIHHLDAIPNVV
jgi:hypothetical protein